MSAALEMPVKNSAIPIVEQMKDWSLEDKEAAFIRLLDEILSEHPNQAMIPLDAGDGIDRGHIVTPLGVRGLFEKYGPKLTAEDRAYFAINPAGKGKTYSAEEVIASMNEAAAAGRQ